MSHLLNKVAGKFCPRVINQGRKRKMPQFLSHLLHGAIKPGFEFPLEILHTKAPVGLNNA